MGKGVLPPPTTFDRRNLAFGCDRVLAPAARAAPWPATRRVIDISGDGDNSAGPPPMQARDRAVEDGIVINGIAIMNDPHANRQMPLDAWLRETVIGGPASVVIEVDGFPGFAQAVRRKLVLEIASRSPLPSAARSGPVHIRVGPASTPGPVRQPPPHRPPAREETRTMNRGVPFVLAAALVVPGAAFAETAPPAATAMPGAEPMIPGRAVVETVDARADHVLLRYDDGTLRTYRAGPELRDIGQLSPGDRITVELAESTVVRWIRDDIPLADRPIAGPTTRLVATVEEIAPDGRTVVLRGAGGERHRVALPEDIDASMVQTGERVTVEVTEAVLVRVGSG